MKTNVKKLEKCQVALTVTLDAEETAAVVKDVEKVFLREAQMPGFRKGKVPLDVIRRNFAAGLKEEIERMLVRKYYETAVKEEKVDEVALTNVHDIVYGAEGGGFVAEIDVKPTFKLPTYKGLKISRKDTAVKDEAVEEHLSRLRKGYAKLVDAPEGATVAQGDYVELDYKGTVDGKPITEINPEAKIAAEGTHFWVMVEEGRFLPEILKAIVGMKSGETKEGIKAKFDKASAPKGLEGAKAVYTVKIGRMRRYVMPTDAEFLEKTKAESLEKLTADTRAALEKVAVEAESRRREDEAVELLLKKVDFDVPQSVVMRARDAALSDFAQQAQYSGLDASYFEKNRDKILADAEAAAVKRVRLWYVLKAIADAEKIEGDEDAIGKKAIEFVLANAKQ